MTLITIMSSSTSSNIEFEIDDNQNIVVNMLVAFQCLTMLLMLAIYHCKRGHHPHALTLHALKYSVKNLNNPAITVFSIRFLLLQLFFVVSDSLLIDCWPIVSSTLLIPIVVIASGRTTSILGFLFSLKLALCLSVDPELLHALIEVEVAYFISICFFLAHVDVV